ncbi:MAG: 16S rRNA (guanine(527)-N(7))-methyltransferase RsmG [Syntrophobacteraceae bacterium]
MMDFIDILLSAAARANIAVTQPQAELLSRHVQIMLDWNSRINLTRITAPEEVIVKHLLDSIAPARCLPVTGRALDVGAGAGFPGIPLKIVSPDLDMLLLESTRKKVNFLNAAAASLQLPGLSAQHQSWQDFRKRKENVGTFQLIVMRAIKPEAEHINRLAASLLAPGGFFARWESLDTHSHKKTLHKAKKNHRPDVEFYGEFAYSLPGLDHPRVVRLWQKAAGVSPEPGGLAGVSPETGGLAQL